MACQKKILYCRCQYANVVPKGVKDEVLARLAESGHSFQAVPDLCEMSARKDPTLHQISHYEDLHEDLHIVACFPRAVKALFHAADVDLSNDNTHIHNMRSDTAEHIMESLQTGTFHAEKTE